MRVCIVGNGLVSLTLAKALVNEGVYVDFFSNQNLKEINKSRTIGISKTNIDFFNKEILNIEKILWNIKKIEIYTDNLKNEKILNFEDSNNSLFSIVKNHELDKKLKFSLKKNKFFNEINKNKLLSIEDYKLIINCNKDNLFSKKYFQKKIKKNYNSYAYTTIVNHKKKTKNNTAIQIFTKRGPLAFLPVSETKTSIVYSLRSTKDLDLTSLIKKYNKEYSIIKINQISKFKLNSSILRNYHYKNILAFGDLLHQIHPLAGQGFNMSIRDIKLLIDLIRFRVNHGLELDSSVCTDFEKKIKHKNYIFSSGIDFIYEFFKLESRIDSTFLSETIKFFGKNKYTNKFFTKLADTGLLI